jgi:hypothetical protein
MDWNSMDVDDEDVDVDMIGFHDGNYDDHDDVGEDTEDTEFASRGYWYGSSAPSSSNSNRSKSKKAHRETSSSTFWNPDHIYWPYILLGYVRLGFTLFMMCLTIYIVLQFLLTIHHDLELKALTHSTLIASQVSECSKSYLENKCSPISERLPAMEKLCREWEVCMMRDPKEVGRLMVGAEAVGEVLERLVEPMSLKSMVFGCVLVFGCVFLWVTAPRNTTTGATGAAAAAGTVGSNGGLNGGSHGVGGVGNAVTSGVASVFGGLGGKSFSGSFSSPSSSSTSSSLSLASSPSSGAGLAPAAEQHHHYYNLPGPMIPPQAAGYTGGMRRSLPSTGFQSLQLARGAGRIGGGKSGGGGGMTGAPTRWSKGLRRWGGVEEYDHDDCVDDDDVNYDGNQNGRGYGGGGVSEDDAHNRVEERDAGGLGLGRMRVDGGGGGGMRQRGRAGNL